LFAIATGTERYNLTGVDIETQVENGQNYLCAIATDGHRLAFARIPIENDVKIQNRILPKSAVNGIVKLLSRGGDCELMFSENRGGVSVGGARFVTKLVDATFPDYKKVVPQNNDKVMEIDKSAFLNGIKSAAVQVKHDGVKFIVKPSELELIGTAPDGSQSCAKRSCSFVGATDFKAVHNPIFVEEATLHIAGEKLRMSFSGPLSPMLMQATDNGNVYHVVMPMKTSVE
jgi:DNA polymerase-3 subunit beta